MRVRTVLVSLAALVLSVPIALVAPSAAFAGGHPVDPTTLNPPLVHGNPVCAREGNRIYCHSTVPQQHDLGTVDSGLRCGSTELLQTLVWTLERGESTYDAAGNVLTVTYIDSYTGSISDPDTGRSVAWTQKDRFAVVLTTPGDDTAGTATMLELQKVYGPTGRVILTDAGTEVLSLPDGARLKATGHHPIDDALYDGTMTGLAPLCHALA